RAEHPPGCSGDRQCHLRRDRRAYPPRAVLAGSGEAGAVVRAANQQSKGPAEMPGLFHLVRFNPDVSLMTLAMACSLPGAMMCTPATPGMVASSRISSTESLRPSAAGSAAASKRAIIASGMIVPYSLSFIQRADLAERSGEMPIRNGVVTPCS